MNCEVWEYRLLSLQVFNTMGLRDDVMLAPRHEEVNWEFLTPRAVLRLKVSISFQLLRARAQHLRSL